jgi:uncharacterized protein (TIGR03083 family)
VGPATRESTAVDFVLEFAAAAERVAVAVTWSDLKAAVPSCPGWSTYDVLVHLGNVHAWAATIVETGREAAEQNDEPTTRKPRTVSSWYAGKAEDLYRVLRSADPDDPCWNFAFGTGTKGFWSRRQLHETAVHLIDLDRAAHRPTDLAPVICRDGVDEVLRVFMHRMHQRGHRARLERPLALTATDTGDSWVVTPRPGATPTTIVPSQPGAADADRVPVPSPTVEHRRTTATTAPDRVVAPADVLYRVLWKRLDLDEAGTTISGDEARVRAFLGSRLVP